MASDRSLTNALEYYFKDVVRIDSTFLGRRKRMVTNIIDIIKPCLEHYFKANVNHMWAGSVYEHTKVVKPDEFDVQLVLSLDPDYFEAQEVPEAFESGSVSCQLFFQDDNSRLPFAIKQFRRYFCEDTEDDDDMLVSPTKFKERFQEKVVQILNDREMDWDPDHDVERWEIVGTNKPNPPVTLKMKLKGDRSPLYIDMVPTMSIHTGGNDPVYYVCLGDKMGFVNLWRKSYAHSERNELKEQDRQHDGCRSKCYMILKTLLEYTSCPLRILDSYILKNVIFSLKDRDWRKENLDRRFKGVLHSLEDHLNNGHLAGYFGPDHNLLAKFKPRQMNKLADYLEETRQNNSYEEMLELPIRDNKKFG